MSGDLDGQQEWDQVPRGQKLTPYGLRKYATMADRRNLQPPDVHAQQWQHRPGEGGPTVNGQAVEWRGLSVPIKVGRKYTVEFGQHPDGTDWLTVVPEKQPGIQPVTKRRHR